MIIEVDSIELDFICSGLSLLEKDFLDPKSARVEKIRKLRLYLEERYREGPDPLADLPALRSATEVLGEVVQLKPKDKVATKVDYGNKLVLKEYGGEVVLMECDCWTETDHLNYVCMHPENCRGKVY